MKIPVFYHDDLSMGSDEWISLSKPKKLMNAIRFDRMADVCTPNPVTKEDLYLAHNCGYVDAVCSLRESNGFGNTRSDVMRQVLSANGAFLAAAERALETGVAFAPVSGFHHAGWDYNGGYCTFNGLMVASLKLLDHNKVDSVLILDFDGHYGDGTDDIITEKCVSTKVRHLTRSKPFKNDPNEAIDAAMFAIEMKPSLVMLQAGADSLIGDPFGAGYFNNEDWLRRDYEIFKLCRHLNIPIVWNLAGGYNGEHTIKMHYGTWRMACEAFANPPSQNSKPFIISSGACEPSSI